MFLLMGAFVVDLRHEPGAVPRRQHASSAIGAAASASPPSRPAAASPRSAARRSRPRRRSRRRLSGNAPLRLSAILRHRRDRGRRHAGRDAAAVDRARGLRHHHRSRTSASCSSPASCPGLLAMTMYMITIALIGCVRPGFLPDGAAQHRGASASRRCATSGRRCCCSCSSSAASTAACFTPTEAGGVGAGGAFLIGVLRGTARRATHPAVAAAGDAHGGGGVHGADRRAAASAISSPSRRRRRRSRNSSPASGSAATACWR